MSQFQASATPPGEFGDICLRKVSAVSARPGIFRIPLKRGFRSSLNPPFHSAPEGMKQNCGLAQEQVPQRRKPRTRQLWSGSRRVSRKTVRFVLRSTGAALSGLPVSPVRRLPRADRNLPFSAHQSKKSAHLRMSHQVGGPVRRTGRNKFPLLTPANHA